MKTFTCCDVCRGTMTGWLTRTGPTVAITVEFGSAPAADRLRGPRRRRDHRRSRRRRRCGDGPCPGRAGTDRRVARHHPRAGLGPGPAVPPALHQDRRPGGWSDGRTTLTGQVRADVNRAQRTVGRHGFDLEVRVSAGRHRVCVSGGRYGSSPTAPAVLARGCMTVIVPPFVLVGRVEQLDVGTGRVQVGGWALDPQLLATSGTVRVLLDGRRVADIATSVVRRDLNSRMHVTGRRGFARTITAPPGRYTIEVIALARNTTSTSRVLLRRIVTVWG